MCAAFGCPVVRYDFEKLPRGKHILPRFWSGGPAHKPLDMICGGPTTWHSGLSWYPGCSWQELLCKFFALHAAGQQTAAHQFGITTILCSGQNYTTPFLVHSAYSVQRIEGFCTKRRAQHNAAPELKDQQIYCNKEGTFSAVSVQELPEPRPVCACQHTSLLQLGGMQVCGFKTLDQHKQCSFCFAKIKVDEWLTNLYSTGLICL